MAERMVTACSSEPRVMTLNLRTGNKLLD